MLLRPVDAAGDALPVLSVSDLLTGPAAAGRLARHRLRLLAGDWWEDPSLGCEVLELLRENRFTEQAHEELVSYLTSYLSETPGVLDVTEVDAEVSGRVLRWSCTLVTEEGGEALEGTVSF